MIPILLHLSTDASNTIRRKSQANCKSLLITKKNLRYQLLVSCFKCEGKDSFHIVEFADLFQPQDKHFVLSLCSDEAIVGEIYQLHADLMNLLTAPLMFANLKNSTKQKLLHSVVIRSDSFNMFLLGTRVNIRPSKSSFSPTSDHQKVKLIMANRVWSVRAVEFY
uniref:Uncharacterized protein n=1 Tax=Onchocerca volvulus TaxID=6282 RepID=A0A8R1TX11_ONCVO